MQDMEEIDKLQIKKMELETELDILETPKSGDPEFMKKIGEINWKSTTLDEIKKQIENLLSGEKVLGSSIGIRAASRPPQKGKMSNPQ